MERKRREVEQGEGVLGRGAFERWGREDKVERREGAGKRLGSWMLCLLIRCFAMKGIVRYFALPMQR
jgi:hypothetical protein